MESIIEIRLATTEQSFSAHFGVLSVQQKKLVEMYMKKHPSVLEKFMATDHDED